MLGLALRVLFLENNWYKNVDVLTQGGNQHMLIKGGKLDISGSELCQKLYFCVQH